MSQRHIRFNVNELARLGAEAIGAKSCVSIKKYPDGMYNKTMLLTMEDGTEVVAKVPNPNAGQQHFTTASEVATMEFVCIVLPSYSILQEPKLTDKQVREVLGTPVPKVHAWSSRHENAVGAEYIIMEKLPGIELERVWAGMGIEDRFTVVRAIAQYQKAWMSVSFQKFGSLYYATDIASADLGGRHADSPLYTDQQGFRIMNSKFAIGPSTGREFFDDGRAAIEFDRGPCKYYVYNKIGTYVTESSFLGETLEKYQSAIGHREIACINSLPQLPKSPIALFGPGTYQPTREKKLRAANCYLDTENFSDNCGRVRDLFAGRKYGVRIAIYALLKAMASR